MLELPLPAPGETPVRVLTIAGSDSGGSAGLQSDLRTFALTGVHGTSAITAVTVQNSLGVTEVHPVPPRIVAGQIRAVVEDLGVQAAKTGLLTDVAVIEAVAAVAVELGIGSSIPFLADPVCASHRGDPLLSPDALGAVTGRLFPMATVVTPNLDEVRLITGIDVIDQATQRDAARALLDLGPRWALVKGGHLRAAATSPDVLYDGENFLEFDARRLDTPHDHGAGDTLGAAIVCALAYGQPVPAAVEYGKDWITRSLAAAYPLGAGLGPVSPAWRLHDAR